jgi:hypothetical protein
VRYLNALAAAATVTACAFADVFKPAEEGNVRFVWVGDTVVNVGSAIPFQVVLEVDGTPVTAPAVRTALEDNTNIDLNAAGDSLLGLRPGFGNVLAWVETSLAPRIDTAFRIRARP